MDEVDAKVIIGHLNERLQPLLHEPINISEMNMFFCLMSFTTDETTSKMGEYVAILKFSKKIYLNHIFMTDKFGRTALHMTASAGNSTGLHFLT